MTAAFVFCAGLIPLVPLIGANVFKRRKDNLRRNVCYALFAIQLLLSIFYIISWLNTH